MNLVKFQRNLRIYWVSETLDEYIVKINSKDSSKYFPNAKLAWGYAERLALNLARRRGSEAVYTTHPYEQGQTAWVVQ